MINTPAKYANKFQGYLFVNSCFEFSSSIITTLLTFNMEKVNEMNYCV